MTTSDTRSPRLTRRALAAAACAALLTGAALPAAAMPKVAEAGLVMNVAGEASRTLPNDEAQLTFSVEARSADSASASDKVVKAGNAALEALKVFGDKVDVKTTDFSTWPVMTRAKEGETSVIGAWAAKQSIRVTVKDVALASKVMQAAGATMTFDGVAFSVSRAVRQRANDELLAEAIKNASDRAVIAAKALGLGEKNVRIEAIESSGSSGPAPRYYAQPQVLMACAARVNDEPAVSSGTADLTLTVSLTVRIMP